MSSDMRIVFMGTPEFAVASLGALIAHGYQVVGVITAPDKASGRGQHIHASAVKKYAQEKELNILQPPNLKDPAFLETLAKLKADLQIVVAFRMLPESVWAMPSLGTINLHASLLPDYRGAAPINWAVINGDSETGLTTFFIEKEIDTGKVLLQDTIQIPTDWSAGQLHDEMMEIGGSLLIKTIELIASGSYEATDQATLLKEGKEGRPAPKIFKQDCKIDWSQSSTDIYNLVRGLTPYPTAWSELMSPEGHLYQLKIFKCRIDITRENSNPGAITSNNKDQWSVTCADGSIGIEELQLAGKKRMVISDFLRGFDLTGEWKFQ